MLQLQLKNQAPITVSKAKFTIGQADRNNLVINDTSVDPVHALLIIDNQRILLKDNTSQGGSYVNNIRVTERAIKPGDNLRFGNIEVTVLDGSQKPIQKKKAANSSQWVLKADSSWLEGQSFPLTKSKSIVGRGSQCDITIPGTHLSRQHAELTIQGNRLQIKDLASANGTFINDRPITDGMAKAGDQIRFDVYSFRLEGPTVDRHKTQVRAPAQPIKKRAQPEKEQEPSSPDNKRWKTKPTSIGNRPEPPPRAANQFIKYATLALAAAFVGATAYFFLLR